MIKMRVLVIDDEPQIQHVLNVALSAAGYDIVLASTAAEAVRKAATAAPDMIVLDLGLPDRDGKEVIADIRAFSKAPILVLSARDREIEKIAALDAGADDYVEKPFAIGEFLARLRAAGRHIGSSKVEPMRIVVDELVVDMERRRVTLRENAVHLTPKEYEVLTILARHAGRVVTHRQILTTVWGKAHLEDTQYLRVFIGQLRSKIDLDASTPSIIQTEPGVGYRFKEPTG
jgi:two-component system KDP operon response regulator KdpE